MPDDADAYAHRGAADRHPEVRLARAARRAPCWPSASTPSCAGDRSARGAVHPGRAHGPGRPRVDPPPPDPGDDAPTSAPGSRSSPRTADGGAWARRRLADVPALSDAAVSWTPTRTSRDEYLPRRRPASSSPPRCTAARPAAGHRDVLKQAPARFDTAGLAVRQYFATSADGTRVPYFVVGPERLAPAPAPPCSTGTAASRSP